MIHNPWTITMGDSEELRKNADVMDKMKAGIIAAYRQKSHLSEQEISDLMDEETWMTAEEALENGFVDSIDKTDDSSAKNFDLSKFRNSASFLSRLQHEHKARGKRAPKPGTPEGKVTLQDLENATHPEEEPPPQPHNPPTTICSKEPTQNDTRRRSGRKRPSSKRRSRPRPTNSTKRN
jgi:ATP-dependent Clp protease protease subunit